MKLYDATNSGNSHKVRILLALDRPTIADIACFPYVETAPEAKIALDPYPKIAAWLARCKALPGWPAR